MLITTASGLHFFDPARPDVEPVQRDDQAPAFALEGIGLTVTANRDGALIFAPSSAPATPAPTAYSRTVDTEIDEPITSLLLLQEAPPKLLVGTEGAHLFLINDDHADRIDAFDQLKCRKEWHTPWGGPPAVRSMARTPDGHVYADIHVGSIMHSPDDARTWEPVEPELHEDVHQVVTCPAKPTWVYANTADSVWVSPDRGLSWEHRGTGLANRYGRAIAVCPDDGNLLLASVSDGPHGDNVHAQLFRSEDAGQSWQQIGDPLPDLSPQNIDTHRLAFSRVEGRPEPAMAFAAIDNVLYASDDRAVSWHVLAEMATPIERISVAR